MTDPTTPAPEPAAASEPAAAAPAPAAAPAAAPAPTGDYPGKILGIVGLILSFVFALLGLILSAVALSQSKKAGFKNTPAKVGLILGIIFSIGWIIFWIVWGVLIATVFNVCAQLGPGVWDYNGVTYTCG
jgi:hypothetical protein